MNRIALHSLRAGFAIEFDFEMAEHVNYEQQLLDKLRDQKRQYEIDRIIDESNNR